MRKRNGISIVEVIVALMVFTIGALGSAGVLANAVHARTLAHARREAVHALRPRAMLLGASPCAALANGAAVVDGVAITWVVSVTQFTATVALHATHRGTSTTLNAEFPCA